MKMHSLNDLFVDLLRDMYDMETQITKALPKMAKAASSPELRAGFEEHLEQTKQQIERLMQVFEQCDLTPRRKSCSGMEGIIEEGKELRSSGAEGAVLDAGLIAVAQKVEHYEMACYGTARTWAKQLGKHDCAQLLQETLDEEKATDQKLNHLTESMVNQQAQHAEMAGAHSERQGGQGMVAPARPL
jgi:ferritin-like metal-binding protein YciE